jgi:hypothetical protein
MITGKDEYKEDALREYVNPENIEQAPEGFASRVMMNIRMEPARLAGKRNRIPYISSAMIILLVMTAAMMPAKELALPDILSNLNVFGNFQMPAGFSEQISELHIPGIVIYIIAGILFLTAFDGILSSVIFRRKKS